MNRYGVSGLEIRYLHSFVSYSFAFEVNFQNAINAVHLLNDPEITVEDILVIIISCLNNFIALPKKHASHYMSRPCGINTVTNLVI